MINTWGKNVYVKIPVVNSKGVFMGKIIKELNNPDVAGVYGRQQPFSYSSDLDKRDLLTTK